MKKLDEKKMRHYYAGEALTRPVTVTLSQLDDDDDGPPGWYEMVITHPSKAKTSRGEEYPQAPELFRFPDEKAARHAFEVYCGILNSAERDPELN